jgi:23S rRNA (guanosine2251-2'-O)-methyltransferase
MAGNSQRKGAKRSANVKGSTVGTGGHPRQQLEGRGPTPKAEDRKGHVAARRAAAKRRTSERPGAATGAPPRARGGASRGGGRGGSKGASEVVAGRNPVVEALRAGVPATALQVAARIDMDERVREVLQLANDRGLPLLETTKGDLDRLTGGAVHQGLALQVPAYAYAEAADLVDTARDRSLVPLLVALDGVTDPRNLGAIVRSVAAFGGHGVLVPERRAAGMTASAWKTSAGTAARIPVARATNLTRALVALKEQGCFVVGLDAHGAVDIDALEVAVDALVIVVGSEGKGLSRLVRETCDLVASIPMGGSAESLNAAVAAGVALYEVARKRRTAP